MRLDREASGVDTRGVESGGAATSGGRETSAPPGDPSAAQAATRPPETPQERHARRVAWGFEWGQIAREHARTLKPRGVQ